MENLSSGQAKGLHEDYATVINRLGNLTRDILSKGYEKRVASQYRQFAKDIQSFYDGTNQYAMENFSDDQHYNHRAKMKKFLKKIGMKQYVSVMESTQLPPVDLELPFAQFFFTRDLKFLKPLFRKFCSPYWEWNKNWDNLLKSNNELRPNTPYWGWHSGQAEATAKYQDLILHSKTAAYFAALDQKFMDPAEIIQFMIYLAVMKKKLLDTINWTMCPRSRWSDVYVPFFSSDVGKSKVFYCLPGYASDSLLVRVVSVLSAVSI